MLVGTSTTIQPIDLGQIQIFQKWWENGVLETSKLLENNTMPKVADTLLVSADPDLVDMGKGIIGRIRGHS